MGWHLAGWCEYEPDWKIIHNNNNCAINEQWAHKNYILRYVQYIWMRIMAKKCEMEIDSSLKKIHTRPSTVQTTPRHRSLAISASTRKCLFMNFNGMNFSHELKNFSKYFPMFQRDGWPIKKSLALEHLDHEWGANDNYQWCKKRP